MVQYQAHLPETSSSSPRKQSSKKLINRRHLIKQPRSQDPLLLGPVWEWLLVKYLCTIMHPNYNTESRRMGRQTDKQTDRKAERENDRTLHWQTKAVKQADRYPASSWFLVRRTRQKLLRATVHSYELTVVQRQRQIN